jgi:hypothetical protein
VSSNQIQITFRLSPISSVGIETVFYLESLCETGWRPEPPINQETAWRKLITAPRENGGPRTPSGRIPRRRLWRRCVSLPRKIRKPAASKRGSGGTRVQQIPPSSLRSGVGRTGRPSSFSIVSLHRPAVFVSLSEPAYEFPRQLQRRLYYASRILRSNCLISTSLNWNCFNLPLRVRGDRGRGFRGRRWPPIAEIQW